MTVLVFCTRIQTQDRIAHCAHLHPTRSVGIRSVGSQQPPATFTKDCLYVQQVCLVKRDHRRPKGVLVPSAGSSVSGICHGSQRQHHSTYGNTH